MNRARGAIQLVVGFSKGSASNIVARIVCPTLSKVLGQAINIEHLPGENGALAAERVAVATPDGNTLGITVQAQVIGSLLAAKLRYNPVRDFAPVALFAKNPMVLVVSNTLGVNTVAELIALARLRPGALVFGTSAVGGLPHLAAAQFCAVTGIRMQMRVYSETNTLYEDLAAGRIALSFNNTMSALPLANAGKIRMLASTSLLRSAVLPELPTVAETTLPGYDIVSWVGLWAPAATTESIVDHLNSAITRTVQTPEVSALLRKHGIEPVCAGKEYFSAHLSAELARWSPFISAHQELLTAT